ncbi:type I-C CRISPR-associated protein Cas8c/Csd1 [Oceanobacillus caeni]|uniref:type I-C CRISPR-associated protein Cas8c/Csd1 n=1 Tax=Bacillaceae TaxID=186817 RepID=UPI0006224EBC|nr:MULTISPECIES: type I-C CRISPR-associated protein Cas8c/Csd1 [Bacillaceae]KKE77927.1 CRISPR-associated protein Cas8 [Bacilli bacterium VT-13-104]PZD81469.1 type I-C CRISPR-associated protein Cas8c/Csd1 [Bacilli bacterium]MCR1836043.1 type I-C CRISPR-associated protein Cas8c/Csd1 [Oceanobacillus caeni]MED4473883.1 type I-C CRISPR-associated protein Cas8c/Csd1 [Oceanobacillus caeni]PZD83460.1 type I-C CRISPR-associated protein Cas8c/Csd1 [Bacilli bacterium]
MSWLYNLYKTYEMNTEQIGKTVKKRNDKEYTLLPISHTTQNAHIEVTIDEDGDILQATVLEKENTIIPCTEESASRAGSKIAPYPLHDKLSYVAGDFVKYGGKIKNQDDVPFDAYIQNLKEWAESPYAIDKVKSIYKYLSKGRLIEDLVKYKVLVLDENQQLIEKWNKKYEESLGEKPLIFSSGTTDQVSAFVRFNVYSRTSTVDVWKDREMYQSFIDFYNERLGDEDVDFITGELAPSTERHANKIRHAADKAKLISANDTSGFTFRGRFKTSKEAAGISYEVSQKAHNALKWLIHRQGKTIDNRVFLVWGNDDKSVPDPGEDALDILYHANRKIEEEPDTDKPFAEEVKRAIDGYRNDLNYDSEVNILVLDSATTGRMAVLYYRNMNKEIYLNSLKDWHSQCSWEHRYRKNEEKFVKFYGAPATRDIAFAAYGPRASDKIVKGLMERMLPCIIDGQIIPKDIVKSAFQRASNPVAMERWEWEKTLSIACALIRKSLIEKKEEWDVALDKTITDRSYLFGRLLAVADVLERGALGKEETRATNAIRYMNSFSQKPSRTWMTLQASLQPYQARLGTKANYLSKIIDEISDQFAVEDFNNKPLSEKYLLGFYSQRRELYKKKEINIESEETNK